MSAAYAQSPPQPNPSIADWQSDIDSVVRDLIAFHPEPFAKTGRLTFMRAATDLKGDIARLTEEQRVVRAMKLVAMVGDGHTQLEPTSLRFARWYPVKLYEFSDGYFIVTAHTSVADLAGAEVLELGHRPVSEVVEAARDLMGDDNVYDRKQRLFAVMNAAMMQGLGYANADGSLPARFRLKDGREVERLLQPRMTDDPRFKGLESGFEWQFRGEMFGLPFDTASNWISAYKGLPAQAFRTMDESRPLHLMLRTPYASRSIPAKNAYYIQLNQTDDTKFVPFIQKALQEVDAQRPQRLIIDMRNNFGGDGSIADEMIREFIKRSDNRPWKELYILTGRKTFSAGIMVLNEFVKYTDHTLVGEPAGASLNSFGDAFPHVYERTGLKLEVSTRRNQLSQSNDLREVLPVDVPAPFSFADYVAARDPAVDPILNGEEMRGIVEIALADGGAAARKTFLERKRRFSSDRWWVPPTETDLRFACRKLLSQKRFDDAVETCRLSTEVHPEIWNSWYNLAEALVAADRGRESAENFACVLKIDPLNWNEGKIRKVLAEFDADPNKTPATCGSVAK